jgi:hypothetical protein
VKFNLFVPVTKVDVEKREVWGRAVQEVPDKSKEIFDYATSAPLFRDWSAGFDKATDGKSLGNIRAMHGKVAAGKVTAIDFNDKDLAIDICAKVVDDAEWNKVQEGVYTGFSIGGDYEKRWQDGGLKRYTARPSEISLVDNPCVPTARFQMIKADGVVEEKEFKAPDPAAAPVVDPAAPAAEVKKSMYSVQMLASLMSSIASMVADQKFEAALEGDDSPIPSALRSWLASGLQILNAMTAEESAELLASLSGEDEDTVMTLADSKGDLAKLLSKAGARHSASDQKHLQGIHDSAVAMGAGCGASEKAAASGDLAKVFPVGASDLGKAVAITTGTPPENGVVTAEQIESLGKFAITVAGERDELKKKVEKLEAEPAEPKGVAKVVDKGSDSVLVEKKDEPEDKTPLGLMKKAHANPTLIKL